MARAPDKLIAVRALPPQLVEHVVIYIEEQLYTQALSLLASTVVSKHGILSQSQEIFAFLPSTQMIALLATLTVHPSLTTRATTADKTAAADQSLALLEHIVQIIGPITARLDHAFAFSQQPILGAKRKLNKRQLAKVADDTGEHSGADSTDQVIHSVLANQEALFTNAEDFWHIVGWAFNCSIKHRHRWARWELWLSFHLKVLETDWSLRLERLQRRQVDADAQTEEALLEESIIMQYLQPLGAGASRTARRRAMRAIFALGSDKDLTEFPEVFRNELKERRKEQTAEEARQRQRVNVDEGDFGDYYDEDNDETLADGPSSLAEGRRTARRTRKDDALPANEDTRDRDSSPQDTGTVDIWGGIAALGLRQRLLVLLTQVSIQLPDIFAGLAEVLDIYTEFMRPLPVPIFALLLSPHPGQLSGHAYATEVYISLVQMLLLALVGSAKAPKVKLLLLPGQSEIQTSYLPCASSSSAPADNAKISLLLEGLLRVLLQQSQGIQAGQGFKTDVEWGIEVRRAKASNMFSSAKKIRIRSEDAEANQWLASSETRLALLADLLENSRHSSTTHQT